MSFFHFFLFFIMMLLYLFCIDEVHAWLHYYSTTKATTTAIINNHRTTAATKARRKSDASIFLPSRRCVTGDLHYCRKSSLLSARGVHTTTMSSSTATNPWVYQSYLKRIHEPFTSSNPVVTFLHSFLPSSVVALLSLVLLKPALNMFYHMIHSDIKTLVLNPITPNTTTSTATTTSNQTSIITSTISPTTYGQSFVGQMETPIRLLLWFPLALSSIDVLIMLLRKLGLIEVIKDSSTTTGRSSAEISRMLSTIANAILVGSFATKLKDWIFYQFRLHSIQQQVQQQNNEPDEEDSFKKRKEFKRLSRNAAKDKLFDELTSFVIWMVVGLICLQVLSIEFGFALKSVFAIGGISSASFIWAWRSTMENIVGGLLLKFQDKFHVGDRISIPSLAKQGSGISGDRDGDGIVEEIHYITTKLRCVDNDSIMIIPNALFISGHIINWSRTSYRLFTTMITVKSQYLPHLLTLIEALRDALSHHPSIEDSKRDVKVTAIGFDGSSSSGDVKVEIRVSLHGSSNDEQEISKMKTSIVDLIAKTMTQVLNGEEVRRMK